MTPPFQISDTQEQRPAELRLSTGLVSVLLTIIMLLIGGAISFASKTSRGDVREIVDDKLAPVNQKYDQIMKAIDEVNSKLDRQSVSR